MYQRSRFPNFEQHTQEAQEAPERIFRCTIKRLIAQKDYVSSVLRCQVGDVIILEDGEEIIDDDSIEPRSICFLASLYETEWKCPGISRPQIDSHQSYVL